MAENTTKAPETMTRKQSREAADRRFREGLAANKEQMRADIETVVRLLANHQRTILHGSEIMSLIGPKLDVDPETMEVRPSGGLVKLDPASVISQAFKERLIEFGTDANGNTSVHLYTLTIAGVRLSEKLAAKVAKAAKSPSAAAKPQS